MFGNDWFSGRQSELSGDIEAHSYAHTYRETYNNEQQTNQVNKTKSDRHLLTITTKVAECVCEAVGSAVYQHKISGCV